MKERQVCLRRLNKDGHFLNKGHTFKGLKEGAIKPMEREKVRIPRSKDRQWVGNKNFGISDHVQSKILAVFSNP